MPRRAVTCLPLRVPFLNFAAYYEEINHSPLGLVLAASDVAADRTVFEGDLMAVLLQHKWAY